MLATVYISVGDLGVALFSLIPNFLAYYFLNLVCVFVNFLKSLGTDEYRRPLKTSVDPHDLFHPSSTPFFSTKKRGH